MAILVQCDPPSEWLGANLVIRAVPRVGLTEPLYFICDF